MLSATRSALIHTRYPKLPTSLSPKPALLTSPSPPQPGRMFSLTPHRSDQPKTFAHAKSLPKLPVPKLDASLERYVQSLKPLLLEAAKQGGHDRAWVEQQLNNKRQLAKDFAKSGGIGQVLQARLEGQSV